MFRKLFIVLVVVSMLSPGIMACGWMCKNGPMVTTNLNTTVDVLKALVDQLGLALLSGYDAEIELAYIAAKGSLAGAQALLTQSCPDTKSVDAVLAAADKVAIQGNVAFARAKKLKLVK